MDGKFARMLSNYCNYSKLIYYFNLILRCLFVQNIANAYTTH